MKSLIKFLLPLLITACGSELKQPAADTVFINGKVLTLDHDFSNAEARAVTGTRIVAVGDSESVAAMVGDETQVVDLPGMTEPWGDDGRWRNRLFD